MDNARSLRHHVSLNKATIHDNTLQRDWFYDIYDAEGSAHKIKVIEGLQIIC